MENDIAEFQRLGAFHAASAMECVVKGGSAHLKMAVWHQNHAAHYYGSARGMLTKVIRQWTKHARITELEAELSAAKAIIAEYAGINPVQDWREAIKIVQKARAFMKTDAQILNEFVNNNDPETMRARNTELEAELVFVRGQLEVALGTIKIQRCSVDAILSAVGDDPRVAKLRDCLVEKTSAPPPAQ